MAIHINRLNGGNITIGSGGSAPESRTTTRVWYGNDPNVYTDYEIDRSIYGDGFDMPTDQITNVTSAKKIELGNNVTNIGSTAFYRCYNLTDIIMSNNVTTIGQSAFVDCTSLTSVIVSNNTLSIDDYAFSACTGLTSITIPDSVTSIGDDAFSECIGLTSVTIVATGKPGASAASVKQAMINAGVDSGITWNMPS